MIAKVCNLNPGYFVHSIGDAHLYLNHIEQADLQLTRKPKELPTITIKSEVDSIFDFKYEDFVLEGYDPHPLIKAPVAI